MISKTLREYYVLSSLLFAARGFIFGTYATFLSHRGLNYLDINLVNCAFYATIFLCEVPTGAFADVYGRKNSVFVACMLSVLGSILYAVSNSFALFISAEIIVGVAMTFQSGALRAWFVDKLHHHGYGGSLSHVFAHASTLGYACMMVSIVAGAYLGAQNDMLPWLLSAGFFILAAIVTLCIREEYFVHKAAPLKERYANMKTVTATGMQFVRKAPHIRFIILLVCIQTLALQAPNMQWQLLFGPAIGSDAYLGYIGSSIIGLTLIGSWSAPSILKRFKNEHLMLIACSGTIGLCFVVAANVSPLPYGLTLFLAHEVIRGAFAPIKDAYLHHNTSSDLRATVDSFGSIGHHAGGFAGLLLSGVIAEYLGIPVAWLVSGFILIACALHFARNK